MAGGSTPMAVQNAVCAMFGVRHYDDAYEKVARWPLPSRDWGRILRRRIDPAVLGSQLLFIHVPKNAGTSIAHALYGYSPGHKTAHFYDVAAGGLSGWAGAFAVLRDPLERFLSAYWFIQNNGGDDVAIEPGFAALLAGVRTIDDLLDFVERRMGRMYDLDHVLRPQWWYVTRPDGSLLVRQLFLLDRDQAALTQLLKPYGVGGIPYRNRTGKGEISLTDTQRARILALYARDVELVGAVMAQASGAACSAPPALAGAR